MIPCSLHVICIASLLALRIIAEAAFLQRNYGCDHWTRFGLVRTLSSTKPFASVRNSLVPFRRFMSKSEEDNLDWLSAPIPDAPLTRSQQFLDDGEQPPDDLGNIQIPSTGISVTDELDEAQKDTFVSELVPIKGLTGVAQIVTLTIGGGLEPVKYLVSLSPPNRLQSSSESKEGESREELSSHVKSKQLFVMMDVPPFSAELVANMRKYMGTGGHLSAILITSRDGIHYDEGSAVYTTRNSDLEKWKVAFPDATIVGYRLDIPRDCRELITQRLDGYGPWALEESKDSRNVTFVETGRPLTYEVWDTNVAKGVMDEGSTPPDDDLDSSDDDLYTPEAIRAREEGKRVIAIYTPGHTFGSLTYIVPDTQVCCSGFTIPVEDDRLEENFGMGGAGPALDYRGYITTSKAGMSRMMESARHVVNVYSDRFTVVLPSRGDPLFVDMAADERRADLLATIDQYDKIGKVYEQLGIISSDEDEENSE